jgi:hypothetical protein
MNIPSWQVNTVSNIADGRIICIINLPLLIAQSVLFSLPFDLHHLPADMSPALANFTSSTHLYNIFSLV